MAFKDESANLTIWEALSGLRIIIRGEVSRLVLKTYSRLDDVARESLYKKAVNSALNNLLKYYTSLSEELTFDRIRNGFNLYIKKTPSEIALGGFSGIDVIHFIMITKFLNSRIRLNCGDANLNLRAGAVMGIQSTLETLDLLESSNGDNYEIAIAECDVIIAVQRLFTTIHPSEIIIDNRTVSRKIAW